LLLKMVAMVGNREETPTEECKALRSGGARLESLPLCRRADPEISHRIPESRADMRRTSRRTLPYQCHRSTEESATRASRSNPRRADGRQETPVAHSNNYRRPFQHGPRTGCP